MLVSAKESYEIVKDAIVGFFADDAVSHSAAMAFFAVTALSPVLLTMAEWGDQNVYGLGKGPVHFVHKTCGHDFHPKLACEACGDIVDGRDLSRVIHEEQALTVGEALEASVKIAAE